MSRLGDRLFPGNGNGASSPAPGAPGREPLKDVKGELHRRLIDRLDLKAMERMAPEKLRDDLRAILAAMVSSSGIPLNTIERERLVQELLDEVTGLGPLEPLLARPGDLGHPREHLRRRSTSSAPASWS